jgi:hypothetical protein
MCSNEVVNYGDNEIGRGGGNKCGKRWICHSHQDGEDEDVENDEDGEIDDVDDVVDDE